MGKSYESILLKNLLKGLSSGAPSIIDRDVTRSAKYLDDIGND